MIKPIALTSGDPNGVGLDISLMASKSLMGDVPFFIIADKSHIAARSSVNDYIEISKPNDALSIPKGKLAVLHHQFPEMPDLQGEQHANASAIISSIERAVDLVKTGKASAVCTNPIHKKVLKDGADFPYPGHTEFLAALAGQERSVMMLLCDVLKVVPVTIHIALNDVSKSLTPQLLEENIQITSDALMRDFGIKNPRLAIAGLNPHAGEQGTFGREDIDMIEPLIKRMRGEGYNLFGPLSADTMFHEDARQGYDAAICMYHDQALIPIKTLDFFGGVNATLGLPFIRTSPDHGTAFDLAGGTDAHPDSLIAALRCAAKMANHRMRSDA